MREGLILASIAVICLLLWEKWRKRVKIAPKEPVLLNPVTFSEPVLLSPVEPKPASMHGLVEVQHLHHGKWVHKGWVRRGSEAHDLASNSKDLQCR